MAAKEKGSILATYFAASNSIKLPRSNWYAGNKYAVLFKARNFTAEVDSVCPNSKGRFLDDIVLLMCLSVNRRCTCYLLLIHLKIGNRAVRQFEAFFS